MTHAVSLIVSAVLLLVGFARIAKDGFGWGDFTGSINEYLFHIAAGLFFGWALCVGVMDALRRDLKMDTLALQIIALVSPILFLVTIHQTRNAVNDGPAAIAMAAGGLIHYTVARLRK